MLKGVLSSTGLLLAAVLVGCGGSADTGIGPQPPGPPPPPPPPSSDVTAGRIAVDTACGSCHTARDGFDLSFFSYTDTTIIRRAVKHVDTTTAHQIVAYIQSLSTPHVNEKINLFQPGGRLLATDGQLGVTLFGQDAWPTLTTSQLLAIDPLTTPIALALPIWSDEASNLDWLADTAPSAGILAYDGNRAGNAVAAYDAAPSLTNLALAVTALRDADRAKANPAAPCIFTVASRVNYKECFELRRWTSTLVAQHMIRNGITRSVGGELHELWWDVGDAARLAQNANNTSVANPSRNTINWMYLGWMFDPSRHPTFYIANALAGNGLRRHATFVALRSEVARPAGSWDEHESIYDDVKMAVQYAPATWTVAVATFGFTHLLERLNSGEHPITASNFALARLQLTAAMTEAAKKVSGPELTALQALADQVKAKL